uniref:Uncharacterized protein n=1 Tax=Arundo donax TaxID=35708 RepID=A0A0A9B541_ARUDO
MVQDNKHSSSQTH